MIEELGIFQRKKIRAIFFENANILLADINLNSKTNSKDNKKKVTRKANKKIEGKANENVKEN